VNILDIIQSRNNQLYGVVNFMMLIHVFCNRVKDKSKNYLHICKKKIERICNPISKLILLKIIGLAISYIIVIIGACTSDYDYMTYILFSSLEFMFLRL